jgi:superfamily II DNA/RNA helicase
MSQPARTETLGKFKSGEINIVVCSDVAARGLDIPDMSHVFNFDVPIHAEDYVHRIGRTGRAGRQGNAYTIATHEDNKYLDAINEITSKAIPLLKLGEVVLKNSNTESVVAEKIDSNKVLNRDGSESEEKSGRRHSENNNSAKNISKQDTKRSLRKEVSKESEKKSKKNDAPSIKNLTKEAKTKSHDNKNDSVKGLGDHVPAFLLTASTKKKL